MREPRLENSLPRDYKYYSLVLRNKNRLRAVHPTFIDFLKIFCYNNYVIKIKKEF